MSVFKKLAELFTGPSRPDGDYGFPKIEALSKPKTLDVPAPSKKTKTSSTGDYGDGGASAAVTPSGSFGCDGGVCAPEMR